MGRRGREMVMGRSRDGHGMVTGRSRDGRGTVAEAPCRRRRPAACASRRCTPAPPPAPPPPAHPSPFRPIHHSLTPSRQRPNPPSHALGRTLGPGPPPAPAAPWHPPTAPPRRGRPGPARCSGSQMVGGREGHGRTGQPPAVARPERGEGASWQAVGCAGEARACALTGVPGAGEPSLGASYLRHADSA